MTGFRLVSSLILDMRASLAMNFAFKLVHLLHSMRIPFKNYNIVILFLPSTLLLVAVNNPDTSLRWVVKVVRWPMAV